MPCDDYTRETWIAYPGWTNWQVIGAGGLVVWIGQRPVAAEGSPRETEITIGATTTVVSGHARTVRVDLVGHRGIEVYLDDALAVATVSTAPGSWQAQPLFVLGEGCAGLEAHLTGGVDGATGIYDQTNQVVRYFAATLTVTAAGATMVVPPADTDKVHAMGDWGSSGEAPFMPKRQVVCVGGLSSQRGRCVTVAHGELVVQPTLSIDYGAALTGSAGLSWPSAGWLAGTDATGPYLFANHKWPLASPLGTTGVGLAASIGTLCAQRGSEAEAWLTTLTPTGSYPTAIGRADGTLALPGSLGYLSVDLGQHWYQTTLSASSPPMTELNWTPSGGYLSDADGRLCDFNLAVGCQPAGEAVRILCCGRHGETVVAELSATEAGPWRIWPWLRQLDDGTRVIGLLAGGRYREWQADPPGADWQPTANTAVGPAGGATSVSAADGLDGSQLATGYDPAAAAVICWWRAAGGAAWSGPHTVAATGVPVAPYAAQRPDGCWEVGWLLDGVWHQALGDGPSGPWRLP